MFSLNRFEPAASLRPFVELYWIVRYDLAPGKTHTQTILSYPNTHLAFEQDEEGRKVLLYGVPKKPFVRSLRGAGKVLGVKFRAGGLYPFVRREMSLLTGKTVPATEWLGSEVENWLDRVLDAAEDAAMAERAECMLSARLPERDGQSEWADRIVRLAQTDRTIIRAEQLGEAVGMSLRQLQRLFRKYVGVSPKWVIKRFRLQEAAERLENDPSVSLAELAAELGYFDQAHFVKDFRSVLGQSPAAYKKEAETENRNMGKRE